VDVYCSTARHFVDYKSQPPVIDVRPGRLRGGRAGRVRFTLSKISSVDLRITRGEKVVEARPFGLVGYGSRSFGWDVPRRAGTYTVQLTARDLTGHLASDVDAVTVVKPRKRS
jgi:hypothetical protein